MEKKRNKRPGPGGAPVRKPFLRGNVTDENTLKSALSFFGIMIMIIFIAFIACASTSVGSPVFRIIINTAVIGAEILILYYNGAGRGAEAVAYGEILYQRKEKGQSVSESERKISFHPAKGYLNGFAGTIPFFIAAVILALNTTVQLTGSGTLPSWMQAYTRRADTGNALLSYTQPEGMTFVDLLRSAVRITIIPFVNIVGANNKEGLFLLEKLSPVVLLLPAISYGTGYLTGKETRAKVHTAIFENEKKRKRKDRIRRKAGAGNQRKKEPEQLN